MYLGRPAEDRLAPDEAVSIADLSQSLPRPSYLACPPDYCAAADMPSPIFDMLWDQLREYWKEMIVETRRRSWWFPSLSTGAPSTYSARRYSAFPTSSRSNSLRLDLSASVAVYSRSRYGGYDFAQNRKRVERWLFALQEVAHA